MSGMLRRGLLVLAAGALSGLLAAPAQGAFHLMKIREISGSTAAMPDSAYIELQMYEGGQNQVSGHNITIWDQDGLVLGMPAPIQSLPLSGTNPPNGESQRTILIGDLGVTGRDFTLDLSPYFQTGVGGNLLPGGAACFEAIPVDCVSWGTFSGAANLPDGTTPYGNPLPTTSALNRSIAPNCATLLEATDDTNNAGVDFVGVLRAPRPNATTPTEVACAVATGAGGAGAGGRPQTKIKKRPKNRSEDDSPTFKFRADEAGAKFRCKLDRKPFKPCKSPKTYRGLDSGAHVFKVKAVDVDGNADKTPAKDRFKVLAD